MGSPSTKCEALTDSRRILRRRRVRHACRRAAGRPALQSAVLDAFFGAEREFFLSGGGALVGFHLEHRETTDLDLFTTSTEAFERARVVLPEANLKDGGCTPATLA